MRQCRLPSRRPDALALAVILAFGMLGGALVQARFWG